MSLLRSFRWRNFGESGRAVACGVRYMTPNLNRMAGEGINFTRMYSEPSCTPTRVAFLTGRRRRSRSRIFPRKLPTGPLPTRQSPPDPNGHCDGDRRPQR
ncbi:sulfatase-like hydrolase/transferase [Pirellulales bacterium]|nr:sulfatase-like hydrolase/transferase [Pirellulales bacterium]